MEKKAIKVALIVVAILVVLAIGVFLGSKLDFNQDDNELPSNRQNNSWCLGKGGNSLCSHRPPNNAWGIG